MGQDALAILRKKLKRKLLDMGSPRLQMFFIISFTGISGFLTSALLMKLGLRSMAVRYPLSVCVAYLFFFLSLRIWIYYILRQEKFRKTLSPEFLALETASGKKKKNRSGSTDYADLSFGDMDGEGFLILAALIVVGFAVYAIYIAPVLLAEVLLNAVLMGGFYRRLRNLRSEHWIEGAFKRTWYLFLIAAVLFCVAGLIMQHAQPGAVTVGDFFQSR